MSSNLALDHVIWDPPTESSANAPDMPWQILVVDDDRDVQAVTSLAIADQSFFGKPVELLTARSYAEARDVLREHPDISVALVDIYMETDSAGLETVEYIRETLNNSIMRVLLRSGAALDDVAIVTRYDVDGVLHKAEVTNTQLYAAIHTALRAYRLLREQDSYIDQLGALIDELRHFNGALVSELREPMERMVGQSEVMAEYLKIVLNAHRN